MPESYQITRQGTLPLSLTPERKGIPNVPTNPRHGAHQVTRHRPKMAQNSGVVHLLVSLESPENPEHPEAPEPRRSAVLATGRPGQSFASITPPPSPYVRLHDHTDPSLNTQHCCAHWPPAVPKPDLGSAQDMHSAVPRMSITLVVSLDSLSVTTA